MKKRITFFIAIILFSATVIFAQGGTTGPLTWNLNSGTLTISGNGAMPDYELWEAPWYEYAESIHTTVIGAGVTIIGNYAFHACENMTSVTIPDGVTRIGNRAFWYCMGLISVTIPTSVTTIGEFAFAMCINLPSITIPDGVTTIENYTFSYCNNLTSITIPESVTTIGSYAFIFCSSLPSIIIPNGVITIGEWAFSECTSLPSINLPDGITAIKEWTFANCQNLTSITIPNGVKTIGRQAFSGCISMVSVTIPESVTIIDVLAFAYCDLLPSINIPNSVTTIGAEAFMFCISLTSVTLSNSITAIEKMTFRFCESLTSITIPNGVTKIGIAAFGGCTNLPSINIPNSVTTIESTAFSYCTSLLSVTIPSSVTKIGDYAFPMCTSLTAIEVDNGNNHYTSDGGVLLNKDKTTLICYPVGKAASTYLLPGSVTKIENGAFSGCVNLISIEVENGNNHFTSETGVLFNKDKTTLVCYPIGKPETSYIIPNSVTTIGYDAFYGSPNLTSITIPNTVAKFRERAFCHCQGLTSITFPKSVKSIEYAAFLDCTSLTSITSFNLVPVKIELGVFGVPQTCTLTVPTSAVSAYQSANVWKEFNIIGGGILVNPVANNSQYGTTTGDGLYQQGETATVTATAHENCKFVKWTKSGAEVSTENQYTFTVTEDVELVAIFEENVGVEEETRSIASLRVYPNPTTGELIINNEQLTMNNVEIFDVMGRPVGENLRVCPEIGQSETVINISHLPSGIYFIRIAGKTVKIVKD